jgi:S-(hydroxymethyl)glutathione dehydrogenase / alcohol dehydrogenase
MGKDEAAFKDVTPESGNTISRRNIISAVGTGAAVAAAISSGTARADTAADTPSRKGQKFRGFVRFGNGISVEELRLLPIGPRQVVIRTEASQVCYTTTAFLKPGPAQRAELPSHCGVGTVIEAGSAVERVRVGDRVILAGQAECGTCYNCLRGRADYCLRGGGDGDPNRAVAEMSDGTKVSGFRGGCAELMVTFETYCVPVVTKVSSVELAMLPDVGMTGLSTTMAKEHVEPGTDVVIFGCGPLGLSAIQGARIQGAAQIIAVEPIKYRRELALKLGATIALDPNVEGNNLVQKIRDLCKSRTERWAGGGNTLPDLVVEAVGGDIFPPKAESGPDPTGVLSLRQAWQLCSPVGRVVTTGGYQPGTTITLPAGAFANGARTHMPGNVAGTNALRDLPKYVRLIEAGLFNAKALATSTFPLERAREAFQAVADRTTVAAVIVYS